jgi:hypothetical protein
LDELSLTDSSIFTSNVFSFTAGKQKQTVSVHSEATARLSPSLRALIISFGDSRWVTWSDVDLQDFVRFYLIAYTGDYIPASPGWECFDLATGKSLAAIQYDTSDVFQPQSAKEVEEHKSSEDSEEQQCSGTQHTRKNKIKQSIKSWNFAPRVIGKSKTATLRKAFKRKVYQGSDCRKYLDSKCQPPSNTDSKEDFTPVFLGHTRLYVLANKYGIENLTLLALQKLHMTLVLFRLYESRISGILKLVRYTYLNTARTKDPLRALITEYIANIRVL